MNAPVATKETRALSVLLERIRAARVPRAQRGQSLVLGTWNIRELGKSPRRKESLRYIAAVLRSFDLTVVIELREDLSEFRQVLRYLGPSFRALFSECVRDAGGNRERIAFVYDTRLVEFTGMASHLCPPREKEGQEYLSRVSWWRPPYVASFRSGKFDFVIAAAHIRWGNGIGPRANEIGMLADWALHYAAAPRTTVRDLFLVGDFNVPSTKSEAFQLLEERGIPVPAALTGVFGTDLAQGKRYDQILAVPQKHAIGRSRVSGRGGAVDFYAGSHRVLYPRLNKTQFTFEMSDHLPRWVELECA
jgi:endonuclease/exonuclease/phosphatase family metal-dependent hydrolase